MERKKNLFGETLILYKNQKKIARISARNRNVDWFASKDCRSKKGQEEIRT